MKTKIRGKVPDKRFQIVIRGQNFYTFHSINFPLTNEFLTLSQEKFGLWLISGMNNYEAPLVLRMKVHNVRSWL